MPLSNHENTSSLWKTAVKKAIAADSVEGLSAEEYTALYEEALATMEPDSKQVEAFEREKSEKNAFMMDFVYACRAATSPWRDMLSDK